jgi:multiple sugar transport system substrate-binding protein
MDDTFITPVFNGSTSLREAAGQLIEDTVKSVRRKQTVDDAYMEKLYSDTASLYRLDQLEVSGTSGGKRNLGPLPTTSVVLLSVLLGTWILILTGVIVSKIRNYRNFK